MTLDLLLFYRLTLGLAAVFVAAGALSDARSFRIPNSVSLGLVLLFPAFVLTAPFSVPWTLHVALSTVLLAGGFFLYAKKWAGAGDIKFVAALGLWAGPDYMGLFLGVMALAGGVLSLAFAAATWIRQRRAQKAADGAAMLRAVSQTPVPYGVAIATGGLCFLFTLSHAG